MDLHLQTLKRRAQADGTANSWAKYAAALERAKGVSDQDDGQYALKLNTEQMQTVVEATDLLSRVLCGQLDRIADLFMHEEGVPRARDVLLFSVKPLLFPEFEAHPHAARPIAGPNTPNLAQRAYDIHQVIRHRLSWDRSKENDELDDGFKGVWHYVPHKTSEQPLPQLLSSTSCPCKKLDCPNSNKQETVSL